MPLEPRYEWKTSEEEACEEFQSVVSESYYNQYIELQKENDTLRSYISELRDAVDVYILYIKIYSFHISILFCKNRIQ